ncbi:hypothetical protein ABL78_5821 [Leptomonas seymouri]|uniref:Leucine-rich repeat protein n=1 Tax=Leptomonas seymouri TaxID=5684 RepID=A0A0N1IJG7_LEPSE|nr:hypothetical protein ABL78_5821 [Leptomonas seymouri]|eukprot:KPI85128.1 hypothetical protein ABL78_5821 [Leptomonas seymouri]
MEPFYNPVELHYSDMTRRWLSLYYACSQDEEEETHPVVLSRVIPAIEAVSNSPADGHSSAEGPTSGVTLDLARLCMTMPEWTAALRSLVRVLPLRRLVLRDTNVGDTGLRTLSREMATSRTRTNAYPAGAESAPSVSPPSPSSCTLEVLDLGGTGLTDASPFPLIISTCPRLHTIDLSCNHLGSSPTGLALLFTALQLHPRVVAVNLSHNYIQGTRGGVVMAGLAELIVARSACTSDVTTVKGITAAVATAVPLHSLDLSHNLLGCYYHPRWSVADEAMLLELVVGKGSSRHERGNLSSLRDCIHEAGAHRLCVGGRAVERGAGCESVTAFPLVTALYLNNSLQSLDLRGNGLPDALMEYVEAKLHVNRRTHQQVMMESDGTTQHQLHLSVERVEEALQRSFQRALKEVYDGTVLKTDSAAPADVAGKTAARNTTCLAPGPSTTPLASRSDACWSTAEVQSLLKNVLQSMAAELSLR